LSKNTDKYRSLQEKHEQDVQQIKSTSLKVSILRMIAFIGFGISLYYYINLNDELLLIVAAICLIGFFILIRIHGKLSFKRKISDALVSINKEEIDYIQNKTLSYDNGSEYIDTSHSYSYDLDIFGDKSLFQTLNRTATYIGKTKLANSLLSIIPNPEIKKNQEAIKELSNNIEWRQSILAYSKASEDKKETYTKLIEWSERKGEKVNLVLVIISLILPALFLGFFISSYLIDLPILGSLSGYLFLLNLMIVGSKIKIIKGEMEDATSINKILKSYTLIIKQLESESFSSEKLNALKDKLVDNNELASQQIKSLSKLFGQLDNSTNLLVATLFNGVILYNIHTLRSLYKWKAEHRTKIKAWLEVIGEVEQLNSYANFAYNNQGLTYPELNSNYNIEFSDLGHPLLNSETRINNSVDFTNQNFIILTGSNMAGKSTFLRSLGINMVLAGTGSPICASKANVHPLKVLVTMRLSDSLNDNESYFFAEVKRLKEIMNQADKEVSFVLLDEILRGTNSDDKRTGTVEVIKKIISKKVIGAIATHDLKVCDTTQEYPETLINKCFEVEIINNELNFDYKLRDGICKNKSATFLMKKMEVI
jgi:DNA mismatch repair ATPase MutS